jgi:hypothetical protein
MEALIQQIATALLEYGISGIANIGLIYLVYMLRVELKDVRTAHRVEIAEKDKLITQIQESRVSEARSGFEIIGSIQRTQDAIIGAIRKGS